MRAYPEYKDSGVEWLGEIPSHWSKVKLKRALKIRNGQDFKLVETSSEHGSYPVIGSGGEFARATKYLHDGESILLGRKGTIDKPIYINGKFWTVDTMFYSHVDNAADGKFLFYSALIIPFGYYQTNTTIPSMTQDDLGNHFVSLPTKFEQIIIRNYLDRETARIDKLITEKQNFIKLLKEKRQALISHVVTKGLDPDVKMKESGIEWIGEVPEHWACKSYRYACKIYRGKFGHRPRNDPSLYDGKYPFIQTGDVARAGRVIEKYKQTLNEKGAKVSQKFPAGTLVMAIAANIGDTALLGFAAYAPDSVVGFSPHHNVDIEFLRYSFDAALPALEQTAIQSTQANLNVERIGSLKAVFPPKEEQIEIINFLEKDSNMIDVLVREVKQSINLLKEHRTALISAAVTGKIDVRDQAKESDT